MPRKHGDLEAFALADALAVEAYRLTASLPKSEVFGIQAQLRRAAVSAATNIVEGCARTSDREFAYFLGVAAGSAGEARYLMTLASRLGYLTPDVIAGYDDRSDRLLRSLNRLVTRVRASRG